MSGKKVRLKTTGPAHRSAPQAPQTNMTAAVLAGFVFLCALGALLGVGWLLRQNTESIKQQTARISVQRVKLEAESADNLAAMNAKLQKLEQSISESSTRQVALAGDLADRQQKLAALKHASANEDAAKADEERLQAMAKSEDLTSLDPTYLRQQLDKLNQTNDDLAEELKRAETIAAIRDKPRTRPDDPKAGGTAPPVAEEHLEPIEARHVKIDFIDESDKKRIPVKVVMTNGDDVEDPTEVTVTGRWVVTNNDFKRDWTGLTLKIVLVGESVKDKKDLLLVKRWVVEQINVKRSSKSDGTVDPAVWRYTEDGKFSEGAVYDGWVIMLFDSSNREVARASNRPRYARIAEKIIDMDEETTFDKDGQGH